MNHKTRKRSQRFHRRTAPGEAPGTLVSDATKHQTRLHVVVYDTSTVNDRAVEQVESLPELRPGQILWLDVIGLADARVVEAVGKKFGLHSLALEDVLHVHQRSKAEEYSDNIYFVGRMISGADVLESEQLSLFLGRNFVITFQERPGDCFNAIRERLHRNGRIRERGADYLMYSMIDAVIDAYFPRLEKIGLELDDIDGKIAVARNRGAMNQLHEIRRDLILLRKLLWQHREALNTLVRLEHQLISRETQIYLRDCLDHVVQLMDVSETDRESCLGLQELILAEIGQRTNDIMRVLTLIATVFMPLSFIVGLYGMNFDRTASPWNMPELGWYYGYPLSLIEMALIFGVMMYFFWRRGWFQR